VARRDPAEHRQAERGPELERGGDQGRGQSGLILRHARVGGRLHTGIQQPQPDPHDPQRDDQVAEIGAIHRDAGEPENATGGEQRTGDDDRTGPVRTNIFVAMVEPTPMPTLTGRYESPDRSGE